MKWEEIRKIWPNQYVLLEILECHVEGNKKYVDEMAVIRAIQDHRIALCISEKTLFPARF